MKTFCLVAVFVFSRVLAFAQDEEAAKSDKLFLSGNLGLLLAKKTVIIGLSPQVGYRFNNYFSAGVGFNLLYSGLKEKNTAGQDYFKENHGIIGLNLFGRFYPVKKFFIQVQPEVDYTFGNTTYYLTADTPPQPTHQTFKDDAEIVPCLFVGGGLALPVAKGSFVFTALYDVVQQNNSPYFNHPFFSVGYAFKL